MSTEKALKDELNRLLYSGVTGAEIVEHMERNLDFLLRGTLRTVSLVKHLRKEGDLVNIITKGQEAGVFPKDITEEQINLVLEVLIPYLFLATRQFVDADRDYVQKHLTAFHDTETHQTH